MDSDRTQILNTIRWNISFYQNFTKYKLLITFDQRKAVLACNKKVILHFQSNVIIPMILQI